VSKVLEVRVDLGIVDHVWQDKRATIAQAFDALGDRLKPAIRAAWMAYIRKIYPDGAAASVDAVGEGTLVLDDLDWVLDAQAWLYIHMFPVVNVPKGMVSAMNT
jgi:hypothetical protein